MQNKTLLIVDDSKIDREMLVLALKRKTRYRVIEADSAETCLEILSTFRVDLVLLDILLPGASGSELLKKIREHENLVDLPIVMVTAKSDPADIVECLRAGANDYLTKPVHFDVAVSRIETQLRLQDLSAELVRAQEREALDALIMTYNHEINNPLAIALGSIAVARKRNSTVDLDQLEQSLRRIGTIVQEIQTVTEQKKIAYEAYSPKPQMISLPKKKPRS